MIMEMNIGMHVNYKKYWNTRIGGIMPEEMPTPKKSLKELEREKKQLETKET